MFSKIYYHTEFQVPTLVLNWSR